MARRAMDAISSVFTATITSRGAVPRNDQSKSHDPASFLASTLFFRLGANAGTRLHERSCLTLWEAQLTLRRDATKSNWDQRTATKTGCHRETHVCGHPYSSLIGLYVSNARTSAATPLGALK
jgi:hypothetical protein